MKGNPHLKVFDTPELMSEAVAEFMIRMAIESIDARGKFVIALSGGNTPGKLYTLLASPLYKDRIEWAKTFVFWGDERCVPEDDKRNNAHEARGLLLDKIDIPSSNINRIPVMDPAEAANVYEERIKTFFGHGPPMFDLVLLGLGENGHTASLFPDTPVIHESQRWIKEVYVNEQKEWRITMTALLINQARNIAFLVDGQNKAKILDTVLCAAFQPDLYPAQLIHPIAGKLFWFVDKAAAAGLS